MSCFLRFHYSAHKKTQVLREVKFLHGAQQEVIRQDAKEEQGPAAVFVPVLCLKAAHTINPRPSSMIARNTMTRTPRAHNGRAKDCNQRTTSEEGCAPEGLDESLM